jgi:phosphoglycerol transferase MdoB-like AlkP superfamily enzyme
MVFNVIDRSDIDKEDITFANVWGVADEDLYKKAISVLDKHHEDGRKFFSLLMTTSNHRPYNFPEGRIDISQGTRSAAVKYTDYAIGKFIEDAKNKSWFKDTIFVIIADHCAASAGKVHLPVEKYRIPMIIYSPGYITPGVNDNLSSQIDVPPTILGMLGF